MTLSTTDTRFVYDGNAATTAFSFPRQYVGSSDLKVYLYDEDDDTWALQTISTHYTVTPTGAATNGVYPSATITFVTAPGSDKKVVIYRAPPLTQEFNFASDAEPLQAMNRFADYVTMRLQRLQDQHDRAFRLGDGDYATNLAATYAKADYANKHLGFDASGDPMPSEGATDVPVGSAWAPVIQSASISAGLTEAGFSTLAQSLRGASSEIAHKNTLDNVAGIYYPTAATAAAINTAIVAANAAGGGLVVLAPISYAASEPIFPLSNVALVGVPGKTKIVGAGSDTSMSSLLRLDSSLGSALTAASNAAENAISITLTDGSSLAAGDYVWIEWDISSPGSYTERLITRIVAKPSTHVIEIADPLPAALTSGATHQIRKVNARTNITIRDVILEKGSYSGGGTLHGMLLDCVADSRFEGLRADGFDGGHGISVYRAYNCSAIDIAADDCGAPSYSDIAFYIATGCNLVSWRSTDSNSEGPHLDFAHYNTLTGLVGRGSAGRGFEFGVSSRNLVSNVTLNDCTSTGFGFTTHSRKNKLVNLVASGCQNQGLWFSDQHNQDNVVINVDARNNALGSGQDIGVFTSDTSNRILEAKYATLLNSGSAAINVGCLNEANVFTALQTTQFAATLGIVGKFVNTDAGVNGAFLETYHNSASEANDDFFGGWEAYGNTSTTDEVRLAAIYQKVTDVTHASRSARHEIYTAQGGTFALRGYVAGGLVMGAPTGGDKGAGTINAVGVYDDDVLLTDLVIDQAVDGSFDVDRYALHPIASVLTERWFDLDWYEAQWREHRHLPGMLSWVDPADKPSSGELITRLTAVVETMAVHIAQLNGRLKVLESGARKNP